MAAIPAGRALASGRWLSEEGKRMVVTYPNFCISCIWDLCSRAHGVATEQRLDIKKQTSVEHHSGTVPGEWLWATPSHADPVFPPTVLGQDLAPSSLLSLDPPGAAFFGSGVLGPPLSALLLRPNTGTWSTGRRKDETSEPAARDLSSR